MSRKQAAPMTSPVPRCRTGLTPVAWLGVAAALLVLVSIVLWGLRAMEGDLVVGFAALAEKVAQEPTAAQKVGEDAVANALAMPNEPTGGGPTPHEPSTPTVVALDQSVETDAKMLMPLDEATFLGAQAKGRHFCIIADASNSMKGAPMAQLKAEIMRTLTELKPTSQFYIIFFNAADVPMPYPSWLPATRENIESVRPWVQNMGTILKTLPVSSFKRAFELKPKPDVIFFMTDGIMSKSVPSEVARLNEASPKVPIHTIQFHRSNPKAKAREGGAETQLRLIAEQSGGTFHHFKNAYDEPK